MNICFDLGVMQYKLNVREFLRGGERENAVEVQTTYELSCQQSFDYFCWLQSRVY